MHQRQLLFASTGWGVVSFSLVLLGPKATVAQAPNAKQGSAQTQDTKEVSTPGKSPK